MRFSQKKICLGCKALEDAQYPHVWCALRYPVDLENYDKLLGISDIVPQKPCPKPTTNDNYITCTKYYTRGQTEGWKPGQEIK